MDEPRKKKELNAEFHPSLNEWRTAIHYLKNKENGTKLAYTVKKDQSGNLVQRVGKNTFFQRIEKYNIKHQHKPRAQTTYSFIKIDGEIYTINHGIPLSGKYGDMRHIKKQNGTKIYLLKCIKIKYDNSEKCDFSKEIYWESFSLHDRYISEGSYSLKRLPPQSRKYGQVIQMKYLGIPLPKCLFYMPEDERIDVALQQILLLYDLHETATHSRSGTRLLHGDNKPDNLVYNPEKRRLSLIDFGFSRPYPWKTRSCNNGTPAYLPETHVLNNGITGEKLDTLACARSLNMPDSLVCSEGFERNVFVQTGLPSILPDYLLKKLGLFKYVSTYASDRSSGSGIYQLKSLCTLAALFINIRLNLSIDEFHLTTNKYWAMTVTHLFLLASIEDSQFYLKLSMDIPKEYLRERILKALENPREIERNAAFIYMDEYHNQAYKQDEDIQFAKSFEEICAMIFLKKHGIPNKRLVLESSTKAKAIMALKKMPRSLSTVQTITNLMEDTDLALLIYNMGNTLPDYLERVLNTPALRYVFTLLPFDSYVFKKTLRNEVKVSGFELIFSCNIINKSFLIWFLNLPRTITKIIASLEKEQIQLLYYFYTSSLLNHIGMHTLDLIQCSHTLEIENFRKKHNIPIIGFYEKLLREIDFHNALKTFIRAYRQDNQLSGFDLLWRGHSTQCSVLYLMELYNVKITAQSIQLLFGNRKIAPIILDDNNSLFKEDTTFVINRLSEMLKDHPDNANEIEAIATILGIHLDYIVDNTSQIRFG